LPEGFLPALDRGERAAIGLALEIHADLLIVDDREAVERAHEVGLNSTGTIGVIEAAGKAKLLNVADTVRDLLQTNFRISKSVLSKVLEDAASSQ
jgi:predicted nucleic acid-binding protein